MTIRLILCILLFAHCHAQVFRASQEVPAAIPREFRGAWCAIVYHIDWPSRAGLDATSQKAELTAILDRMQSLHMNALIFQVRPECDAAYASATEPWSAWISGKMNQKPSYDPLAFCIQEAHQRGIEVHAWFNPFRALANAEKPVSTNHVSQAQPELVKRYADGLWCDPAHPGSQKRALAAMQDVARRYDVDGIHIDDYFYPYPKNGLTFPDGKSPAQRRAIVDAFVAEMYRSLKQIKPWLRIGISPFGIWKPGVPEGTTAQLNAYDDLACDARKWLANGQCDYLAPQLYWRIEGPQSYSLLLPWWRAQGTRPVWPGIATSRIKSPEDSSRSTKEILQQVQLSRTTPSTFHGHLHWSVKALMQDRDGIATRLATLYPTPALVPPMPWSSKTQPQPLVAFAQRSNGKIHLRWNKPDATIKKIVCQMKIKGTWRTVKILHAGITSIVMTDAEAIAITAVNRFGNASRATTLQP